MLQLYIKEGKYFEKREGAGRRHPIDELKILGDIMRHNNCNVNDAAILLADAKKNAIQEKTTKELEVDIEALIRESKIFDGFVVFKNTLTKSLTVYYEKQDGSRDFVGSLKDFTPIVLEDFFITEQRGKLQELSAILKPAINPKKTISNLAMLEYCIDVLNPKDTLRVYETDESPHPVVVQGCNHLALKYLPFTEQPVTLDNLNPFLKEFLTRVERHKHLCAVLWTNLIGLKTPYVIYLQGRGGDGKSAFVEALSAIIGSSAPFDLEKFNGYLMYNKSILTLHENNSINIMQNAFIKAVSGGDSVKIEGKNRDAFYDSIRGQVIIVSNHQPKIQGFDAETRRLCYYPVKSPDIDKADLWLQDNYRKQLMSTPNEFFNYCRICYEELKTATGAVREPEGYEEVLQSLRDQEIAEINEKIVEKISDYFEFDPAGKVLTVDIIKHVKEIDKNNKFAVSNFETCLWVDFQVSKVGKFYHGIRRV